MLHGSISVNFVIGEYDCLGLIIVQYRTIRSQDIEPRRSIRPVVRKSEFGASHPKMGANRDELN